MAEKSNTVIKLLQQHILYVEELKFFHGLMSREPNKPRLINRRHKMKKFIVTETTAKGSTTYETEAESSTRAYVRAAKPYLEKKVQVKIDVKVSN